MRITSILAALVITAFAAGCASAPRDDWKFSEVRSAVDAFRQSQPATAERLPQNVRSIRIDGTDRLTVYLCDSPGLKGHACELKLKQLPSGSWFVAGSRFFDY
jgi:hypothetical protein